MPKIPTRITIALDKETSELLEKLKNETKLSNSEIIRRALKFYAENKDIISDKEKIETYVEMLLEGEHIILDVDHWIMFLKLLESSEKKDEYYELHKKIAKSHADQLGHRIKSVEDLLKRLEACNFFKLVKTSNNEYTLVLLSELSKNFIKVFIEELLRDLNYNVEIKEDFSKLRVKVF